MSEIPDRHHRPLPDAQGVKLRDAVITEGRWHVTISGRDADGRFVSYVASADSYLTHGDGVWFGTAEEYAEAIAL